MEDSQICIRHENKNVLCVCLGQLPHYKLGYNIEQYVPSSVWNLEKMAMET